MGDQTNLDVAGEPSSDDDLESMFLRCLAVERRRLYHFIFSLVPNAADAEDVFQQASIAMWKRFSDFDSSRNFYPWACGVAFYTVQNFRRSSARRRLLFSDELIQLIADERLTGADRRRYRLDLLQDCLALLKERDREIVRQAYEQGSTAAEIAEGIGKAVQTVHNRLSKIRRDLLACINRKANAAEWSSAT